MVRKMPCLGICGIRSEISRRKARSNLLWHEISPYCQLGGSAGLQLVGDGRKVVYQTQVRFGQTLPLRLWEYVKVWKRELAGGSP